jgi:hypothetical protein
MIRTGGCRCSSIRFTLTAEPLIVRACWCRDCQYWSAGNATINLIVPQSALTVDGTPAHFESLADSGNHMRRSFCANCGTPLFSQSLENTGFLVIRAGALDNAGDIRPQVTIWTASAPAWAIIDPSLPSFPEQPT